MTRYRVWNENVETFESWHLLDQQGRITTDCRGLSANMYSYKNDVDGNSVFVGDILLNVVYNTIAGIVKFEKDTLRFEVYDGISYTPLSDLSDYQIKVIGNIYQNKDLVTKIRIMSSLTIILEEQLFCSKRVSWLRDRYSLSLDEEETEILERKVKAIFSLPEVIKFDCKLDEYIDRIYEQIKKGGD